MDIHIRYEPLPTEDTETIITPTPIQPADLALVVPSVDSIGTEVTQEHVPTEATAPGLACGESDAPPAYYVATSLPSYEEAERHKMEEAVNAAEMQNSEEPCPARCGTDYDLGTDIIFWCTFILAFLFNWIGFLASMCITQSIAGRYGALAGFGLSLVKWTFIVKHSTDLISDTDWFWWIIMIFGFLIFFRGCTQYIRIKHHWTQLSAQAKERLILYY